VLQHHIVDRPTSSKPGIHKKATPLLGGVAIYGVFACVALAAYFFSGIFDGSSIVPKHFIGFIVGGAVLMVGGYADDRYQLTPTKQLIAPLLAVAVVIISGIGVTYITNPFGGILPLDGWIITLLKTPTLHFKITVWADLFTFVWLMGMMYTTKLLDGLDGLATGVTLLATLVLFAVSLTAEVTQYDTALLALIFSGALIGFLVWNFYPAKIFLGEGGSLFLGYTLALLAIISGAKFTATLMVMALPVLDVARIIVVRKFIRHTSVAQGDFGHLHHAFLRRGFSHLQTVLLFYGLTLLLGVAALALQYTTTHALPRQGQGILPQRELCIGCLERQRFRARLRVEIANTPKERVRGLSNRESLAQDTGMLFIFEKADTYTFWMKDMRFPLDVIWIQGGKVVGVQSNIEPPRTPDAPPQTFTPLVPVDKILEVPAGSVKRYMTHGMLKMGDSVLYRPTF